jgi:ornithine carbamoyltransferase
MFDLLPDETKQIVATAATMKKDRAKGIDRTLSPRRVLGLYFEKQSLRTRVSFESAMAHLGGSSVFLSNADVGLGKRESVADFAKIISSYVDLLAVRTYAHKTVLELAKFADCPVINALSDAAHPCQALADVMTTVELTGRNDAKITFVGDGNNVARDLALACKQMGMSFTLSAPRAYMFDADFVKRLDQTPGAGKTFFVDDPAKAVVGADVVYTDVWTSMGQEAERQTRLKAFADYRVDGKLMAKAGEQAIFLHCLPACRDEEVTGEVIDGPASQIVRQAENRLHAQKALMAFLLDRAKR